jgi:hypothetical protein
MKRKHKEVDEGQTHGTMTNLDEAPTKKREVLLPEKESGLLAHMISILPSWKSMLSSTESKELLPLSLPPSIQSNPTTLNQEMDSKKRHREDSSKQSNDWEEIPIDSDDDDIVGVKKIPRKSEKELLTSSTLKEKIPEVRLAGPHRYLSVCLSYLLR